GVKTRARRATRVNRYKRASSCNVNFRKEVVCCGAASPRRGGDGGEILEQHLPLFGGQPGAQSLLGSCPGGKRAREPAPPGGRKAPTHLAAVPSRGGPDPAGALERGQRAAQCRRVEGQQPAQRPLRGCPPHLL